MIFLLCAISFTLSLSVLVGCELINRRERRADIAWEIETFGSATLYEGESK